MKNTVLKQFQKSFFQKNQIIRIVSLALIFLMLAAEMGQVHAFAADDEGHWANKYIEEAERRKWMKGYPDGSFRPDANMTRAEFSVMLRRALDLSDSDSSASNPFSDIQSGDWHYQSIMDLYGAKIANGYKNGKFLPDEFLTREMAFTMLARAFNLSAEKNTAYQTFSDYEEVSSWAASSISALVEDEYVAGIGDNLIAPQRLLRRGEMASLLISIYDGEHLDDSAPTPGADADSVIDSGSGSSSGSGSGSKPSTDPEPEPKPEPDPEENGHSYFLIDEEKWSSLKETCKTTRPYSSWYDRIKESTDASLTADLCSYEDNDPSRLLCADTYCDRLMNLAFVYRIEGDEKYAERAWLEIENAAKFPDWNPLNDSTNFAAMMKGTGYAYNWLYDYFNKPENKDKKDTLIKALVTLGLDQAKLAYDGKINWGYQLNWVTTENNHNIVTNTGVAIAALSLVNEEDEELVSYCNELLEQSLASKENFIQYFGPDGAWPEGTGYWTFATKHLAEYTSAFESITGKDPVNLHRYGLENTTYFYISMTGLVKAFNLNDEYQRITNAPQMFYFAKYFDDPAIAAYRYRQLTVDYSIWPTIYDLLWYDPENVGSTSELETDFTFRNAEVATFRNSFFQADSVYAGIHGGKNAISHGQIDAGQFVYDALGERWAIDLGRDNYNLYKYFNNFNNIPYCRWAYYRNRGEGHNTVILNPERVPLNTPADQPIDVTAEMKSFEADSDRGMATVDMQPIYGEFTNDAQRGMMLNKQNGSLLIQDELSFIDSDGNNLYWFMHTEASIDLSEDCTSAILTQNGKRLWVGILDGVNTFTVMDAKPLETSPNPDEWDENKNNPLAGNQDSNDGITKLCIHNDNAGGEYVISVYMIPLEDGQDKPDSIPTASEISKW